MKDLFPSPVGKVMDVLLRAGFQAYLVGGSVRDILLHREPADYDVATDARPSEVKSLFPRVIPTGEKYGTVTVREDMDVEVTTFRRDGRYLDGRRPQSVAFSDSLEEDVLRRDFTVNALAMDRDGRVIDLVNGLPDLERRLVRCVGDPRERFREDALRMMRAIRFACQLEGNLEKRTGDAIKECSALITKVSKERIRDELVKILLSNQPGTGVALLESSGLLAYILPEVQACVGFGQKSEHHDRSVFGHIIATLDGTPPRLNVRLAALLHDIGKPGTFSVDAEVERHFYGHHLEGEKLAREALTRLRFDSKTVSAVATLVREHMSRYKFLRPKNPKKFINAVGVENLQDLFDLQAADIAAHKPPHDFSKLNALKDEIRDILVRGEPLTLKDLAVDGDILKSWGMKPGKKLGEMLEVLLEKVLDDPSVNTVEGLRREFDRLRHGGSEPPKDEIGEEQRTGRGQTHAPDHLQGPPGHEMGLGPSDFSRRQIGALYSEERCDGRKDQEVQDPDLPCKRR